MIAGVITFIVVGPTEIIISLIFVAGLLSLLFMYVDEKRWSRKSPGKAGRPRGPGPARSAKSFSSRANDNTPPSTKYGQEVLLQYGQESSPEADVSGLRQDKEEALLPYGEDPSAEADLSGLRQDEEEALLPYGEEPSAEADVSGLRQDEKDAPLQDEVGFIVHDVQEPSRQDAEDEHSHDTQKRLHLDLGELYSQDITETYLQDVGEFASIEPSGLDATDVPRSVVPSTTDTPSDGSAESSDGDPEEDAAGLERLEALQQDTIEYILSVNASDRIAASDWAFYDHFLRRMDAQRSRCCEIIAARRTAK